jgi:hypothetical protein
MKTVKREKEREREGGSERERERERGWKRELEGFRIRRFREPHRNGHRVLRAIQSIDIALHAHIAAVALAI